MVMNNNSSFQDANNQSLTLDKQAAIIRDKVIDDHNIKVMRDRDYDLYWLTSRNDDTKGLVLQVAVYHQNGTIDLSIQGAFPAGLSSNNRIDYYGHHKEFMDFLWRAF